MDRSQLEDTGDKTSVRIDRLKESDLQSSIFRHSKESPGAADFDRLRAILENDRQIPTKAAEKALRHIQDHLGALGLAQPSPSLILHWLTGLLRQEGYTLGEVALQSLELSLGDVEWNIFHPVGFGSGPDQNPEATSQRIARRIKSQFAARRVFQEEVIQAHDQGDIELLHLGAIDRPHDVFLTPDYLKTEGLPVSMGAPAAGPAKRADVLLAHMIRFTHELQNHFAGDIQWGYVNTLLLPFTHEMSDGALHQFIQQMLFEFAQLDVERGGLYRRVILDFDFELPRHLSGLQIVGPGGKLGVKTYGDLRKDLYRFNDLALAVMKEGDKRGNPFHSPRVVFHFNDIKTTWGGQHQRLMALALKFGNPSVGFSYHRRDLGPLGMVPLNDPDFLKLSRSPGSLRGFSSSALALNLPRLVFSASQDDFPNALDRVLDIAVTAHRQKRLFISRLMAYGNRGPLQFLRRKVGGEPFLKIDKASQPMNVVGLGEAAAMRNGSPLDSVEGIGAEAKSILAEVNRAMIARNRLHKLNMFLGSGKSESLAYRFAYLDLHAFGQEYARYLFRQPDQAHPIYTEGTNIFAFNKIHWRDRLRGEGKLHHYFKGSTNLTLFFKYGVQENEDFLQRLYHEAQKSGVGLLQMAPDMQICLSCFIVLCEKESICPECKSNMLSPYGLNQSNFSPVPAWCLGKRSEWKIRYRFDDQKPQIQERLPLQGIQIHRHPSKSP